MANPTVAEVEAKVEKNEALSPEENKVLMSIPNDEPRPKPPEEKFGDDVKLEDMANVEDKKADERQKTAEEDAAKKEAEKKAAEEKAKADETAKQKAEEQESHTKVERDIEKPIERVDLKNYTDRERKLFFEMRGARRRAQEAEAERDKLRFQQVQREAQEKADREKAVKTEDTREDNDEFITAKRARELATEAAEKAAMKARQDAIAETNTKHSQVVFNMMTADVRRKYEDADAVLNQAEAILKGDPEADAEMKSAVQRGENVVELTYHLVKKSPKWIEPKKAPDKVGEDRAKRAEENEAKPKTLGAGAGTAATGDNTLTDILNMSADEYAKLPKAKRQAILKKYGV